MISAPVDECGEGRNSSVSILVTSFHEEGISAAAEEIEGSQKKSMFCVSIGANSGSFRFSFWPPETYFGNT